MFHADPFVVAVALLVGGVVGSLLPVIPGGLLSAAGVGYHVWTAGSPGPVAAAVLITTALFAAAVDWLGGAVSARAGGASVRTAAVAAGGGLVLAVVLGPVGFVLGIFAVVFGLEYRRHGDPRRGGRAAAYATVGILVSAATQVALTAAVLAGFLFVAL